jgi:hypothetical protein
VVGRPTKRTPEREQRLLDALAAGNTRNAACDYAGITRETFSQWRERFADFSDRVKKAESSAEVRHVAQIAKAASEGVWQASAWWLERRRPDDWARRFEPELTTATAVQVNIAFDRTDATLTLPPADED